MKIDIDKKTLMEDLFFNGYAQYKISLLNGKVIATVRNLAAKDQLAIENSLSELKGSTAFVLHTYSINLLSKTLLSYGKQEFKDSVEARGFLENLPGAVIDYIVKQQTMFEKEIAEIYTGEEIDKVFFGTASTEDESKESLGELTSENVEASEKASSSSTSSENKISKS
jgi:hypothetical protein